MATRSQPLTVPVDDAAAPWLPPAPAREPVLPAWLPAHRLPPLVGGADALSDRDIARLIAWLRNKATFDEAVAALGQAADPASLDHFLRAVFDLWRESGGKTPDRWAFLVTKLGGEACAASLGIACRQWAKDCNRVRANEALQILGGIGIPAALMEISNVALTTTRGSVRRRAKAALEEIAAGRGLSLYELEDRIVPECGLDFRGQCLLDFGARQFHIRLTAALDVRISDESGTLRDDLPRPVKADDPVMAAAALAKWKTLRKQLRGVLALQSRRLELAMTGARRWSREDFETLLVSHPVMNQLARRLIWTAGDSAGNPQVTFRVCDDRTYADATDGAVPVHGIRTVSAAHPLFLSDAELDAWRTILHEYGIMQPFDQIDRMTARLDPSELEDTNILVFRNESVEFLSEGLQQFGWMTSWDASLMNKSWPGANVTAVLGLDPPPICYSGQAPVGPQRVTRLFFITGLKGPADVSLTESVETSPADEASPSAAAPLGIIPGFLSAHPPLILRDVPEAIISDVIRDIRIIQQRRSAR